MSNDEARGQLIARLREDRLWTREELAKRAGVTPTTVTQAETGRTHVRLRTLGKLADALGVPAVSLLRPTEEKELATAGKVEPPTAGAPEEDPLKYLRVVRAFIWKTHDRWKEDRPQTGREATTVLEALDALLGEGVFDLKEGSVNPSEWFELALIRNGARKLASIAEEIEGEGSPRQRRTLHLVQEKTSA